MSPELLQALFDYHNASLRELSVSEFQSWWRPIENFPTTLDVVRCQSMGDGRQVGELVSRNSKILKKLHLGNQSILRRSPPQDHVARQSGVPLSNFFSYVTLSDLQCLEELELVGLNLQDFAPSQRKAQSAIFLNVKRLFLQSCNSMGNLLLGIADLFSSSHKSTLPGLKHFCYRSEASSGEESGLLGFLASFSGLETLSILIEGVTSVESIPQIIGKHGPTLRSLTLEHRISHRLTLAHDTCRPLGAGFQAGELWLAAFQDIARLCPNLVELGTGYGWRADPSPVCAVNQTMKKC